MVPPEKPLSGRRKEIYYFSAVCAVFVVIALFRPDLIAGAFRATAGSLAAGGMPALKVTAEILLFAGILWLVARTVPFGADPARDIPVVLAASLFGYLAEAWGTRAGLWTYYTGETPPLWIVPAWFIGALVVDRLSRSTLAEMERRLTAAVRTWLYRGWLAAFVCVFIAFSGKSLLSPAGLIVSLPLALSFFYAGSRRDRDAAVLFTGTACVFFADLWGTTNHCWTYHIQGEPYGLAYGISFGALFDSAVVLASIKTAEFIKLRLKAPGA
ncbi:MAG: hypothetical protein COT18_08725 [Elusimicrobia bacterium CG08_land_8_20_14_0_20_59_10]|nr:MAG: hypothetical protein COT18_08725 [Elusimicrobia bacterium CG08_land_8_20_14_0_20_59_10]